MDPVVAANVGNVRLADLSSHRSEFPIARHPLSVL
jgi:hypothetical protein